MLITLGAERVTVRVNVSAEMEKKGQFWRRRPLRGFNVFFLLNNCHHFELPK